MESAYLTPAWLWLYSGVILMFLEILTPGFVIFFFGLSAVTVAGLVALLPDGWFGFPWQLAVFSVLAVVYLVGLRRFVKKIFRGDVTTTSGLVSEYVGRTGSVTQAIKPGLAGRVMVGDSEWNATASVELAVGTAVVVTAQQNLTFVVKPVEK